MTVIGDAYIQIIPTTNGISGSITNALSGEASSAGLSSGESIANGILGNLSTILSVGAVAGALKGVYDAVDALASKGDVIDKQSQKLGLTAEQYQVLGFAAEHSGTSIDKFTTAAVKLEKTGFDGTVFDAVDAIMAIEDPTERASKATDLFGEKLANELKPLINGSMNMADYTERMKELGGVMSDDMVSAGAMYEDAMLDMHTAMDGLKYQLLGGLIPGFATFINSIASFLSSGDVSGFVEFFKNGANYIIEMAQGFISGAPDMISSLGGVIVSAVDEGMKHIPEFLESGAQLVMSLAQGLFNNAPAVTVAIFNVLVDLIATIASHLPEIYEKGYQLLGEMAAGVINAIPQIIATVPKIFNQFKEKLGEFDWLELGRNIVQGLANGILGGFDLIGNACKSLADTAMNTIKSSLGIASPSKVMRQYGQYVAQGFALGISDGTDEVSEAMNGLTAFSVANASNGVVGGFNQTIIINSPTALDPSEVARQTRIQTREYALAMRGI